MTVEHELSFPCFGGDCTVIVAGDGPLGPAADAARAVQAQLLEWHARFSRFLEDSELSRLNADPRNTVTVSPELALLAATTVSAAEASDGLVDATFAGELEDAGYREHLDAPGVGLREALLMAPARRAAGADPRRRWASISVADGAITRPPGVRLDSGGLAKGLFADLIAQRLHAYDRYAVNCCGDLRIGGRRGDARDVQIEDPFGRGTLHSFPTSDGAVATSGIGRRAWLTTDGRPAHHLLDPATGAPAYTGLVQVTALAPTAVEAEWRAKAALLCGPAGAARWLPHGGLVVRDDGSHEVVHARPRLRVAVRDGRIVMRGNVA